MPRRLQRNAQCDGLVPQHRSRPKAAAPGRLLLRLSGRFESPVGDRFDLEPKDAALLAYLALEGPKLGDAQSAADTVREAVDWIEAVARKDVPESFRESFLERNVVNRRLRVAATRAPIADVRRG